jgi:GNAT superfamily N-acetyltransferase
MSIQVREIPPEELPRYAEIPIAFRVESVFRVDAVDGGLGGFRLVEEAVEPYMKDYDALADERPTHWLRRFDVSNWGFFLALDEERTVGGATVACDTPGVDMLGGRTDLAVLWDLRVAPERRGQGIGSRLFGHVAEWARKRGCKQLKIETQNVNVRACRFYAKQGCTLGSIDRHGYAGCPEVAREAMLLWYLDL